MPGIGGGGARIDRPVSRLVGGGGGATLRKDISSPASEPAVGDIDPRGGGGGTARPEIRLSLYRESPVLEYIPSVTTARELGTGGAPALSCRTGGDGRSVKVTSVPDLMYTYFDSSLTLCGND